MDSAHTLILISVIYCLMFFGLTATFSFTKIVEHFKVYVHWHKGNIIGFLFANIMLAYFLFLQATSKDINIILTVLLCLTLYGNVLGLLFCYVTNNAKVLYIDTSKKLEVIELQENEDITSDRIMQVGIIAHSYDDDLECTYLLSEEGKCYMHKRDSKQVYIYNTIKLKRLFGELLLMKRAPLSITGINQD